ncbi:hypothetical protein T03_710 [Trichinella britovi]|uniref:Secreted protein n=1 Tax=Trichinella britovi TaxID=45882 RepID=A0A0V1CLF1_TRIBR|nr:hypothetical protein T03_710 [Trichinella britovi]
MVNLVIRLICSLVPLADLICKIGSRFYFDDDHHHRLDASNFALVVAFPIGFHTRSVKRDQGRHNFRFFSITVVIGQIFSSAYCRGCWKMKCGDD